ncbi:MAG: bifunctional demethylmenaquinone methyltransferase/2-methoxy-6-polyprenyl-1,4-benzoquinol methylase UbiE [Parachlamydiaceae bacterium]|nr:bifunctional demethylmenaquinone methyltransferase/2-methoxy-6-polyprenyl-1,4-benzoquinol methylase UbiE [Parachlamydiaceae bacterium]
MDKYNKNDPASIQSMFTSIANNYDRTNAILSLQLHKYWNRSLIRSVVTPASPKDFLDLCSGTGEIAFTYLKQAHTPCQTYLLDFSEGMLACAKDKASRLHFPVTHQLHYIQADAQKIPLPDSSIDCATIAYGIRNVKEPGLCLQEVLRVLRPGGTFGILELTQPSNPLWRFSHRLYLNTMVPLLGRCFTSNQAAYQYLCNSIQSFIQPADLKGLLLNKGFHEVKSISLIGGIATILVAKKSL